MPDRAKRAFQVTNEKFIEMKTKKEILDRENIRYRDKIVSLKAELSAAQQQIAKMNLREVIVFITFLYKFLIKYVFFSRLKIADQK